jgi:hypothetical protein
VSKNEILAELPNLKPEELAEVQAKLDELIGDGWIDNGELPDAHKAALDSALLEYQKDQNAIYSWQQVKAHVLERNGTVRGMVRGRSSYFRNFVRFWRETGT